LPEPVGAMRMVPRPLPTALAVFTCQGRGGRRECLVSRDSLNGGPPKAAAAEYLNVGHVFSCQTTATSPGLARLNATRGQQGHIETAPLRVFAQTNTTS
jgi:hypothetical protein